MEVPVKFRSVLVNLRFWLLAFVFLAVSTFLVSCGGGGTTVVQNTISVANNLTIYVSKTTPVYGEETVQIRAWARYDGSAVPNLTVTFRITDNQSGCDIDDAQIITAVTNANGYTPYLTYTSGILNLPATDTITITAATNLTRTIDIDVIQRVDTIALSVSPTTPLVANGTAQATIDALVKDDNGFVVAGVNVDFSTTNGGILCDAANCLGASGISLTIPTEANGKATVFLKSLYVGEEEVLGETLDADDLLISDSAFVTFIPGPPAVIALTAQPDNVTADGVSQSLVSALVTDAQGHLVADGTMITFSITSGAGDGGWPVNQVSGPVATIDGVASLTYTSGTPGVLPASVDILATDGVVNSGTSGDDLITLIAEEVGGIVVTLDYDTLTVTGPLDTTAVYADVTNILGDPMVTPTPVTFKTVPLGGNGGDLDSALVNLDNDPTAVDLDTVVVNTAAGTATAYLQVNQWAGSYFIAATSGGKTHIVPVLFAPGLADSTNSALTVVPSIPADGSTAVLTLNAEDLYGNPVADDTPVEFSTTEGDVCEYPACSEFIDPTINRTVGGTARAMIKSSTTVTPAVTLSAFIDDGSGVTETATMAFGDNDSINPDSIQLTLSGGRDGDGKFVVVESPGGSIPAIIKATVRDLNGDLIPDCPDNIQFSIVSGPSDARLDGTTTFPVTKSTDAGEAQVSLSAGAISGSVRIEVKVVKESDCSNTWNLSALTTAIIIASGPAANIYVYPSPNSSIVNNADSSRSRLINALVTDVYGNPVENGTAVSFTLDNPGAGETVCPEVYTGGVPASGCVGATVNTKGVARTRQTWPRASTYLPFELVTESTVSTTYFGNYPADEPVTLAVSIFPSATVQSGAQNITVEAEYTDGSGYGISGREITFSASSPAVDFGGAATDTADTDVDGIAQISTLDTDTATCLRDYAVTITAVDATYSSGSTVLTVTGTAPTATFTIGGADPAYTFDATASSTPVIGANLTCTWDFGDSGTDTGCSVAYDYAAAGNLTAATTHNNVPVTLTVTDDTADVCDHTLIQYITVTMP